MNKIKKIINLDEFKKIINVFSSDVGNELQHTTGDVLHVECLRANFAVARKNCDWEHFPNLIYVESNYEIKYATLSGSCIITAKQYENKSILITIENKKIRSGFLKVLEYIAFWYDSDFFNATGTAIANNNYIDISDDELEYELSGEAYRDIIIKAGWEIE